jgi:NADH dehydrogenase [ubiquinone] 1 alpha subcomplex assembly factor 5
MAAARLEDAKVDLPLRLLVLTGWAPSPTQQKPARPGSGTTRLADALGVKEQGTGEKAGKPK